MKLGRLDLRDIPSFRDLNKVVLGIVAIVLTGAVIGGALAVGTLGLFKSRYAVTGIFADSSGLKVGSPVRVAGIAVGEVTAVRPDYQQGDVDVVCELNDNVPLGPSTRAAIGTATLLGGDFVTLSRTQGGPLLQDEPADKRVIPLDRTSVPYTVTSAVSDATTKLQQLDIGTIDQVINQIGTDLSGSATDFPTLVNSFSELAQAVTVRKDVLAQLVADSQQVTGALTSRDQQLAQLINEAQTLLAAVDARRQELAQVLGSSSGVVNQLAQTLDAKQSQIKTILNDLHTTLAATTALQPQINAGLAYAGPVFSRLVAAVGPSYFNIEVTGVSQASLANLNKYFNLLLGQS